MSQGDSSGRSMRRGGTDNGVSMGISVSCKKSINRKLHCCSIVVETLNSSLTLRCYRFAELKNINDTVKKAI